MSVTTGTSATVADTTSTYIKDVFAVDSFSVGGVNYVLAGSYTETGVSLFRVNADGSLTNTANASTGISAEDITTVTTASGQTFAYVGGQQNGVAIFEVGTGGTLTSKGVMPSTGTTNNLYDIEAMKSLQIGGDSYVVTTSVTSDHMTLWKVNPTTGALTQNSSLIDSSNPALELDDIRGMDVVTTAGGNQYIVAAGGDDGIGSYRVNSAGQLESVASIADNATLRLNDVDWMSTYTTTNGQTFVYAGGQDAGISVFRLGENGSLTSVQNWAGGLANLSDGTFVNASLGNMRSGDVLSNGMLAVGSNGQASTYLFEIDEETGQIYLSSSTASTAPEAVTAIGDRLIIGTNTGLQSVTPTSNGDFYFRNAVQEADDPANLNLQQIQATHTLTHNGEAYVIGSSYGGGGISVFRVTDGSGAPPTLTQVGIASPNAASAPVETIASATTDAGDTFVYTAGQNDGISMFKLGADGSLTSLGTQTSTISNNVNDVEAMVSLDMGGTDYLVTSSVGGNNLTLWEINPTTGGLIQKHYLADSTNTSLELTDVRGMDVARMADGSQFIIAGGGDDGVSVFRIDPATKTLVNTFNIADNTTATELNDIDWVTTYTSANGTYAYVGGQDNGITVFRVNADGTLTVAQNFVNGTYTAAATGSSVSVSLGNLRAGNVNDGTGQLVVGSVGDSKVYFFNIDPTTGLISLDRDVTVSGATEGIDSIGDMSVIGHGTTISLTGGDPWYGAPTPDGIVDGTDGSDDMGLGYVDEDGDAITDGADSIKGGGGNDTIDGAGGNDTIEGGTGNDSIRGGLGDDLISGEEGNDTLDGGAGNDMLYGGEGRDNLTGGTGNDILFGGADNDTLTGGSGNDSLFGGDGNDSLAGGDNNDSLEGWDGDDTLSGDAGDDTLDGGAGNDSLLGGDGRDSLTGGDGNDALVGGLGDDTLGGGTGNDTLTGEDGNDSLAGDAGDDSLDGGLGNDTLSGGDNNDTLNGNEGNDTLLGGAGVDWLYGGDSDDSLSGDGGSDTLSGGNGNDILDGGLGNDRAGGDAGDDTLSGGDGDDTLRGDEGNDSLSGDAGNDSLVGGTGNDTVKGGVGNDTLYGDEFTDTAQDGNDSLEGGDGNDVVYGGGGNDTLLGNAGEDALDGGSGNDALYGGDSNDTLKGGTGNDTLYGDAGNDTLEGGDKDDLLYGGDGNDSLSGDQTGTGNDTVYGGVGDDTVSGNGGEDSVFGDDGNDSLYGGDGNDTLFGGLGNDGLYAGIGNDSLNGGDGNDYMLGEAGNDSVYGDAGNDTLVGNAGEDYLDGGDGIDSLYGSEGNDTLLGGLGNDMLLGGNDNDALYGGDGNDNLSGEAGNDSLYGGLGTDTLNGGDGNDTLDGSDGDDSLLGGAGEDSLAGGNNNDTLRGEDGNDSLAGDAGDDLLYGGLGNDTVHGGTGNDLLDGSDGDDTLLGGDGQDTLIGGIGQDTLVGGTGGDSLLGEAGNDSILGGDGNDTVDGGDGDDYINTRISPGLGVPDIGLVHPTQPGLTYPADTDPNNDRDSVIGGAGNDTILTGDDADTVSGGLGRDRIDAGFDNDLAHGDDGDDTLEGNEGSDTLYGDAGNDLIFGGLDPTNPDYAGLSGYDLTDDVDPAPLNNADQLYGGDGNDTIYGQDDADTLDGGIGDDVLDGGIDNDQVFGGAGNDALTGGQGSDSLDGGDGNDTLYGEADRDTLIGGLGQDLLYGGDGNDSLTGDAGNDTLFGDAGNDTVYGGDGNDSLSGGDGFDSMRGDLGDDTLLGDAGNDSLDGGDGNDALYGGTDRDSLSGGNGQDLLYGGSENDALYGGTGNDTLYGGTGNDILSGGADNDVVHGDEGDDIVSGDVGDDTLYGDLGNDSLLGGGGNDSLEGGAGQDTLLGQIGNDTLDGGDGNDSLSGGTEEDQLYGGTGNDTLNGGAGVDTMQGGTGADVFVAEGADLIVDFDTTTGIGDGVNNNNDLVNLSAFYNATTLAAWNAANPGQQYANPMAWLKADQADGVLQSAGGLRLQNGGSAVAGTALSSENTMVVCFTAGTHIATRQGEVAIENLQPGDMVLTMDHGYQPIRWIGSTRVAAEGDLAPILFRKGALNNMRDLMVSPQHRMLLSGSHAHLAFGENEVLAAAKHLVNGHNVMRVEGGEVAYFHILFDSHEIIFAEGCPSESFHPGQEGMGAMSEAARQEIFTLFPQLASGDFSTFGGTARLVLKGYQARVAMAVHNRAAHAWL